jgi:hypothetical protein
MKAESVLATLDEHGVAYLVVGRSAALLHQGDLDATPSLDLCYRQDWPNCECLTRALEQLEAEIVPARSVPIPVTVELRHSSKPVCFQSPAGVMHLLPAVPELGTYDDLSPGSVRLAIDALPVRALSLEQLDCWLERSLRPRRGGSLDLLSFWQRRARQRPPGDEQDSRS